MNSLIVKNLKKHFGGIYVTNDLSLQFPKGKITALIGPNGSGKSTLINILTGVVPFESGTIIVDGVRERSKLLPYEVANLGVTRTFQEVRVFEQITVLDNILVVLTPRSILGALFGRQQVYYGERAEEVLKKVGLWEKRNEFAQNLSYGQRKLLEVGRALAMHYAPISEPSIIFFDEPYAGLFPHMIETIKSIMKELRASGKTLVLVEHNMDIIRELSDHVIVLDEGKLLAEGAPDHVLSERKVIEAYLGE